MIKMLNILYYTGHNEFKWLLKPRLHFVKGDFFTCNLRV